MLYKVWQSVPSRYHEHIYYGTNYGLASFNAPYSKLFGIWTHAEAQGESLSQIYLMANVNPYYMFSQRGHMAKWDGTTGNLLWSDGSTYGSMLNFSWAFREGMIVDDENRVWMHYVFGFSGGKMYRFATRTESVNEQGGAAGLPDLNRIDKSLYDGEWLNEDGTDYAFFYIIGPLVHTLAISNRGDWAALYYNGGLAIHNLKDKRRRGYIQLRDTPLKGVAVNSETLYIFSERGTVEVLDVPRLNHLGTVVLGDYQGIGGTYGDIGVGYDQVYRRLLTFILKPDDPETGECRSIVEGWALDEVGERLTKPLPIRAPKVGRNVPVIGRAYGWEGRGIGGASITAELQLGNGVISPASKTANANGISEYLWVPATEGVDAANIKLTTDFEQVLPGLVVGEQISYAIPAPNQVVVDGHEDLLFPGYWLYSPSSTRVRTRTLQSHLDGYLNDYLPVYDDDGNLTYDPPGSPWKGVLLEYSWYELETTNGGYSLAGLDADIAYAVSKGLKVMLAINTSNPVADGQAWIPNYITQDESGIYEKSWTTPEMSGVFAPQYSDLNARGILPLITDSVVLARLISLVLTIVTRYRDDPTFVGICPLDPCNRNSTTFTRSSGVNYDAWLQARKDILEQSKSSSCLVFEWLGPQPYDTHDVTPDSHVSWCADAGIGLLTPKFPTDDVDKFTRYVVDDMTGNDHQVITGVAIPSSTWSSAHNLQCSDSHLQDTFETLVFGGQNFRETSCSREYVERGTPWLLFVDPDGGEWSSPDTGTLAITSSRRLSKDLGYNN